MAPKTIHNIGFEITGSFDQMAKATTIGIQTVFQPILADWADDNTGAIIKATTAGRIPLKILLSTLFDLIKSGVRKMLKNHKSIKKI